MNYTIKSEQLEQLNNILNYFKYHNKNLTKRQDYQMYDLENIINDIKDYNLSIIDNGMCFANYGEDVLQSYTIIKCDKRYSLDIYYLGCVDYEDIKDDEDMNIDNVNIENSWGSYFNITCFDKEKFNDEFLEIVEGELSEVEINEDKSELSGYDYVSFDNTQDIKDLIINKL